MQSTSDGLTSALVVIPGAVNYFYDQAGRRVAEALRAAGWRVEVTTLAAAPTQTGEWCFLINAVELVHSCGQTEGRRRLESIRRQYRRLVHVLIDCVTERWFAAECRLGEEIGIDLICDLGLHDQQARVAAEWRDKYQFAFNGLTPTESARLKTPASDDGERPLPWALVGHQTDKRVQLVMRLLREFDPRGFCYLPQLEPFTDHGPHLNEEQFQRVLERSRLHVWASHHESLYLESERFRTALLAGALPVKVMLQAAQRHHPQPGEVPFEYLLFDEADFTTVLRTLDRQALRERFSADFCRAPALTESLTAVCATLT